MTKRIPTELGTYTLRSTTSAPLRFKPSRPRRRCLAGDDTGARTVYRCGAFRGRKAVAK